MAAFRATPLWPGSWAGACVLFILQHSCVDAQKWRCVEACKTCHLFDYNLEWHCVECLPGYDLWVDGCFRNCSAGQFRNGYECEACFKHCVSCVGELRHECTQCEGGYHLDTRGVCVKDCPPNQYPTIDGEQCRPCDSLCLTCLSEHKISCTTCYEGYYLRYVDTATESGECMADCPQGFYRDSPDDTTRCLQCAQFCRSCHSTDLCFECEDGAVLWGGVCRSTTSAAAAQSLDFETFLDSGAGKQWEDGMAPNWSALLDVSEASRRMEDELFRASASARPGTSEL